MRPDDPPDHPFPDDEGPRGFAEAADGGYPVETDLEPDAQPAEQDSQPDQDITPPATPVSGRTLHNPLPTAPATVGDDWHGPEPARAHRRLLIPIVVLVASVGLGIWLAVPTSTSPQTIQSIPSTGSAHDQPTRPASKKPTARRTPPPTPARSRTTASPPTPRPARSTPPPKATPRAPTRPPPTVTITTRVTITSRPSRAPLGNGPEEPPRATPTANPAPPCLTWDDCHDDPPKG